MVKEKVLTLLSKFELYENDDYIGSIQKEFALFTRRYDIDVTGRHVEGSVMERNYSITDEDGNLVATVDKEILQMTDTYVLDIEKPEDALHVLMFVLAIDAEKCSGS